jgi:NAD(P)-dependent dehydrogenase (short-subunit alcohol dehydrogenase family)
LGYGFRVLATARDPKKIGDLVAGHQDKARALAQDVTNKDQIKHAVSEAERAFGRIDVLVNNAGYGYLAAVEEGEEKDIRAMFDTNFFGLAAMIRAGSAGDASAAARIYRQYRIGRRDRRLCRFGLLRGHEICS